jgi:acetyl-CoA acetyltransferase
VRGVAAIARIGHTEFAKGLGRSERRAAMEALSAAMAIATGRASVVVCWRAHVGAVACRAHASRNPHALVRDPIMFEDHQNSRFASAPLRELRCCLESDGALAVVVTSAERARDLAQPVLDRVTSTSRRSTTPSHRSSRCRSRSTALAWRGRAGRSPRAAVPTSAVLLARA